MAVSLNFAVNSSKLQATSLMINATGLVERAIYHFRSIGLMTPQIDRCILPFFLLLIALTTLLLLLGF